MGKDSSKLRKLFVSLIPFAFILIVGEILIRTGTISILAIPLPTAVLGKSIKLLMEPDFWNNWLYTLSNWAISTACGLFIGLGFGLVAGSFGTGRSLLSPVFSYFRAIPPIALFPIALIAMGPGKIPIILVAIIGSTVFVIPVTLEAAHAARSQFNDLSKLLHASKKKHLYIFILPCVAVTAAASSRVAATYAFAICIAGEIVIGGNLGVGSSIFDLSQRFKLELCYSYIAFTGIIGILIDFSFSKIVSIIQHRKIGGLFE